MLDLRYLAGEGGASIEPNEDEGSSWTIRPDLLNFRSSGLNQLIHAGGEGKFIRGETEVRIDGDDGAERVELGDPFELAG